MDLSDATRMAAQILDEERVRPTVAYEPIPSEIPPGMDGAMWQALVALAATAAWQSLASEREQRPRQVHESPEKFRFKSVNYDLLRALFTQLQANDRPTFISSLLARVPDPASALQRPSARHPSWNKYVSELPLVAELCVRVGSAEALFRAVAESQPTHGLAVLLLQLEDMIALNFNVFSKNELEMLPAFIGALRRVAHQNTGAFVRVRGASGGIAKQVRNPLQFLAREIIAACDGISSQCKQAQYWYLKGALQQSANLEVDHDKTRVEEHLKKLGFSEPLVQTLNAAEQLYRASATPFELKSCLGHLRSFLEGLHAQACQPIAEKPDAATQPRWRDSTRLLRENGPLSAQEESLATALYTLISDEGVHPLMAEREYARLLRNMVIEYGLMFLVKMDKAGQRVAARKTVEDLRDELAEAHEELSEYRCPYCKAELQSRVDAPVDEEERDWDVIETFACGYQRFAGCVQRPCPADPKFPKFEEYELVFKQDPSDPVFQWCCHAQAKTDMARRLHIPRGVGRTREEAEQRVREQYEAMSRPAQRSQ